MPKLCHACWLRIKIMDSTISRPSKMVSSGVVLTAIPTWLAVSGLIDRCVPRVPPVYGTVITILAGCVLILGMSIWLIIFPSRKLALVAFSWCLVSLFLFCLFDLGPWMGSRPFEALAVLASAFLGVGIGGLGIKRIYQRAEPAN